jgi:uncharacterized protein with ACT and thioredoxin-like domain
MKSRRPAEILMAIQERDRRDWDELYRRLHAFEQCTDVRILSRLATRLSDLEIDMTGDCTAATVAVGAKMRDLAARPEAKRWLRWARETFDPTGEVSAKEAASREAES